MYKSELIDAVSKKTFWGKDMVKEVLDETLATIMRETANGNKVQLTGFGTFSKRKRASRKIVDVNTGKKKTLRATSVPYFTAGEVYKRKTKKK